MKLKEAFTPIKMARASIVILFLALIRCIAEVFRLQYYSDTALTVADVKPFLSGALTASVALLIMSLLLFFGKHAAVIILFILALASLVFVKIYYHLP